MEQLNVEVLLSGDLIKSKEILQLFVSQVVTFKNKNKNNKCLKP